jgi:hypothetical protein
VFAIKIGKDGGELGNSWVTMTSSSAPSLGESGIIISSSFYFYLLGT